ncbi:MAG: hypothetical protein QOE71_4272 [Pseudonocardiales bacterium]|nr:hypothetical protein [Pseudonocardiales bacterium]
MRTGREAVFAGPAMAVSSSTRRRRCPAHPSWMRVGRICIVRKPFTTVARASAWGSARARKPIRRLRLAPGTRTQPSRRNSIPAGPSGVADVDDVAGPRPVVDHQELAGETFRQPCRATDPTARAIIEPRFRRAARPTRPADRLSDPTPIPRAAVDNRMHHAHCQRPPGQAVPAASQSLSPHDQRQTVARPSRRPIS